MTDRETGIAGEACSAQEFGGFWPLFSLPFGLAGAVVLAWWLATSFDVEVRPRVRVEHQGPKATAPAPALDENALGPLPDDKQLRQTVPCAERFVLVSGPPPFYLALRPEDADAPEDPLGYAFVCQWFMSAEQEKASIGYAGPIRVLMGVDSEGAVTGLAVLEHRETPAYLRAILRPEVLAEYEGKAPSDEIVPGVDLDAISGATMSQEGFASTVRFGLRGFAEKVLD